MIELQNVTKRYGSFTAVRDVGFRVDRGEIIGLVGPNGAGKTTTMKMITGYLAPDEGQIQVDGHDVAADPRYAQERLGYLPEQNPIYPEMAVHEYLHFIAKMRGLRGARLQERMRVAAEACNLDEYLGKQVRQLSKGMRQRVGIASAIVHDPDLLILDEPTSGLDPNQIVEIRDLIRELGREKTIILSTHILSEVEETCSRALMIVSGRVAVDDKLEDLVGGRQVRVAMRGAVEGAAEKLAHVTGVESVRDASLGGSDESVWELGVSSGREVTAALYDLAVGEGWPLSELAVERRSLEDVFREVSRREGGIPR
jgi:gliding motility-associated transport system ATP-binding protein